MILRTSLDLHEDNKGQTLDPIPFIAIGIWLIEVFLSLHPYNLYPGLHMNYITYNINLIMYNLYL